MRRVTILGLMPLRRSDRRPALQCPAAGGRADFWPKIKGDPSSRNGIRTFRGIRSWDAGRQRDRPGLVLPFGAMPDKEQQHCKTNKISEADCMVEYGRGQRPRRVPYRH
jgi:hypothetical protein